MTSFRSCVVSREERLFGQLATGGACTKAGAFFTKLLALEPGGQMLGAELDKDVGDTSNMQHKLNLPFKYPLVVTPGQTEIEIAAILAHVDKLVESDWEEGQLESDLTQGKRFAWWMKTPLAGATGSCWDCKAMLGRLVVVTASADIVTA